MTGRRRKREEPGQAEWVEDFYPLSPLQEGLLFHSLASPHSGVYFNQAMLTLEGPLDPSRFEQAWKEVVQRHDALRTFFVWEGLKSPVQVVDRHVELPFVLHDWRGLPANRYRIRWEEVLDGLRRKGFNVSRAPLMRLDVAQQADQRYEVAWSFHHLLLDGWSMFLVLREVFELYESLGSGEVVRRTAPRPFREHIVRLKQQDPKRAEAHWRDALRGFEAPTPLAVDWRRAVEEGDLLDAESEEIWIGADTTARLEELARRGRVTLNSVLQLAWAVLLGRYSGSGDVVFGTIVSGRSPELAGFESRVGLFINAQPVRVSLTGLETCREALESLHRRLGEQREFDYAGLLEVQGWSAVPRDKPLFESLFVFENYRKEMPIEAMARSVTISDIRWYERVNYPLTIIATPGERISLRALFHTARFEAETVRRMLRHLETQLRGLADDPDRRIDDLPLMTEAEQRALLVDVNETGRSGFGDRFVQDLVAAQAECTPEALAVEDAHRAVSYQELDRSANQLARYLREAGVGPDVPVVVFTDRCVEMVIAYLGVLKAGGAYVPLDPAEPAGRLDFMLTETGAPIVLTQEHLLARLPDDGNLAVVPLDSAWPAINEQDGTAPETSLSPANLAYSIFTSGSTGRPKAVAVRHGGLANLVSWHCDAFDVTSADRTTQLASPGFDAAVWEIWPSLSRGASLHLVPSEVIRSPEELREFLVTKEVTVSFLPTPLAEKALQLDWPSSASLRVMLTGGDRLQRTPPAGLPFAVVNNYGPTEDTVVTTSTELASGLDPDQPPPIGRPIANTRVYVLDPGMRPVPVGVPGELYVAGEGLARGYLHDPALTARKFLPDPFGEGGGRLYRTGDRCRFAPDGQLEFLGRLDEQMMLRGFRVEPGEIQTHLQQHPAVGGAVVAVPEEGPAKGHLVAYVVGIGEEAPPASEELRNYLLERLPNHMVPSAFVALEEIPLSSNGKVDRRSLPAVPLDRPDSGIQYVAPTSDFERAAAQIWREVLGVDRVGLHDNFFDLGGHSLLVMEVHHRVRTIAPTEISIIDLYRYPTISGLADFVLKQGGEEPVKEEAEMRAARRRQFLSRRRTAQRKGLGADG